MSLLETLGAQAAQDAVGSAMGLITGGIAANQQLKYQGKLMEKQFDINKRMTDYQKQKELEMWEATGYGAQKKQMIEAGLNPALLYGQKGAGGQTVGGGAAGVNAPSAPSGMAMLQKGDMARQLADIELTKAQTENVKADTERKVGVS